MAYTTLVNVSITGSLGAGGYTFRNKVLAAGLASNAGATTVRVTFVAPNVGNTQISSAYIGNAGTETLGADADYQCATLAQLKFSGNAGTTILANGSIVSDALDVTGLVTVDGTVNLVVSMFIVDNEALSGSNGGNFSVGYKASNIASTQGTATFDGFQAGNWYVSTTIESTLGDVIDPLGAASAIATSYAFTELIDTVDFLDAASAIATSYAFTELIDGVDFLDVAVVLATSYALGETVDFVEFPDVAALLVTSYPVLPTINYTLGLANVIATSYEMTDEVEPDAAPFRTHAAVIYTEPRTSNTEVYKETTEKPGFYTVREGLAKLSE